MTRPHFMIIGAMKCATSTLHEQLALQPGIFMTDPKEPNFFSNDEEYAKGIRWYESLFATADAKDLCGESSTHYTKLPTYPHTIERIRQYAPEVKLIYVIREPIGRLVSQYIHEWSQNIISIPLNDAIDQYPELITYSCYSMQIKPFLDVFDPAQILLVFFEKLCQDPQSELERVCDFIGYPHKPVWSFGLAEQNVSSQRMRKSVLRDLIIETPGLKQIRKGLIPQGFRDWVKGFWMMKKKPKLSPETRAQLTTLFDEDLAILGSWLNLDLTCESFKFIATTTSPRWTIQQVEAPSS